MMVYNKIIKFVALKTSSCCFFVLNNLSCVSEIPHERLPLHIRFSTPSKKRLCGSLTTKLINCMQTLVSCYALNSCGLRLQPCFPIYSNKKIRFWPSLVINILSRALRVLEVKNKELFKSLRLKEPGALQRRRCSIQFPISRIIV